MLIPMDISPLQVAQQWSDKLLSALNSSSIDEVLSCFLSNGWLRDVLLFSWNNRSLEGHDAISEYLMSNKWHEKGIQNCAIEKEEGWGEYILTPKYGPISPWHPTGVQFGFNFRCSLGGCKGFATLAPDNGEWKAFTVFLMLDTLDGHEETGYESGVYGNHTLAWSDVLKERKEKAEANPHVLIVGAGQNGLNVAARFQQMRIPTIVVEKNGRVGDIWRQRYPTLALHTIKTHHSMLYQSYPSTWPLFTPRDKLADWLEQYAKTQDLLVWTSSHLLPGPQYDSSTRRWTVKIQRGADVVAIHPSHIVLATGTLGAPNIPAKIDGEDAFQGTIFHSSKYQGGHEFTGKHVVVIGAGNSSADICQDLHTCHAASVTMIQRSSTCVTPLAPHSESQQRNWPLDKAALTDVFDFRFAALPMGLFKKILASRKNENLLQVKEMHDALRKAGLDVNLGVDGEGHLPLVFGRLGGYWLDVGISDLIISGEVKVKSGVKLEHYTTDELVFSDGTSVKADVVIYATGYENMRDVNKSIFGEDIINKTGPVWGYDEEDELCGNYRPSGYPGLWYAPGDFYNSRFCSKQLALSIKAIELGLMKA